MSRVWEKCERWPRVARMIGLHLLACRLACRPSSERFVVYCRFNTPNFLFSVSISKAWSRISMKLFPEITQRLITLPVYIKLGKSLIFWRSIKSFSKAKTLCSKRDENHAKISDQFNKWNWWNILLQFLANIALRIFLSSSFKKLSVLVQFPVKFAF